MKRNKQIMISAGVLATTIGVSLMPAFAEGYSYTQVSGTKINIDKYLVLKSNAEVPNLTFNYSLTGVSQVGADIPSVNGIEVYNGLDDTKVEGMPVIKSAVFKKGDPKYSSVQNMNNSTIQVPAGTKDPVTLKTGESYAKSNISIDFSNVKFNEPGVYRYKISEQADLTGTVTNDANADRILDVYVVDVTNNGNLSVQGYVLHQTNIKPSQNGENITVDQKSKGYVNKLESKDISVKKQVAGNQASKDEYFKVTVSIEEGLPLTTYNIDLSNAELTTKTNGINQTSFNNPTTITTDASGKATSVFYLQDGQYITIRSLTIGSKYKVNQDKEKMNEEGYTVDIDNPDDPSPDLPNFKTEGTIDNTDPDEIPVVFTDTRKGTIPTGIIMSVAPFATVTLIGVAGLSTILMKRYKD